MEIKRSRLSLFHTKFVRFNPRNPEGRLINKCTADTVNVNKFKLLTVQGSKLLSGVSLIERFISIFNVTIFNLLISAEYNHQARDIEEKNTYPKVCTVHSKLQSKICYCVLE